MSYFLQKLRNDESCDVVIAAGGEPREDSKEDKATQTTTGVASHAQIGIHENESTDSTEVSESENKQDVESS